MRSVLALMVGLAILATWFPYGNPTAIAATSTSGNTSVTCNVASMVEAAIPAQLSFGDILPGAVGAESPVFNITVKSNTTWGMKIKSDLADGRMKEWTGTSYAASPKVLSRALEWKEDTSGSYAAISGTEAVVVTGKSPTSDLGTIVGLRFKQVVSYADSRLENGNTYHILIFYTISQNY